MGDLLKEIHMFTPQEIAYINSQRLARLATVSKNAQPDVAPVVFRFDGETFFISGYDISRTFKYKNVKAGNPLVALVIDDLASEQPWQACGIKIHGKAEIVELNGPPRAGHSPATIVELGVGASMRSRMESRPAARPPLHN